MDQEIFQFFVKYLLVRTLYDKTSPTLTHAYVQKQLTYKNKIKIARAAVSSLKTLLNWSLMPQSFLKFKFQKAILKVLDVKIPPTVFKIFERPVESFPFTLANGSLGSSVKLYVDIEGNWNNPLEITMLLASGKVVVDVLHEYGIPSDQDKRAAPYSHCFFRADPMSKKGAQLRLEVLSFLRNHPRPEAIIVNDATDITKFFSDFLQCPVSDSSFVDVGFPCWEDRAGLLGHQLAILSKERRLNPPPLSFCCNIQTNHSASRFRRKSTVSTLSQLGRSSGCHCSLYDVMELFYHYEGVTST